MPFKTIPGQISLVIAVTGHRDLTTDLAHLTSIRQRFSQFLRAQIELYPNTPIVVIAGMAEGADQLAIEVVRQMSHSRVSYRPVLPMPEQIFLEDFSCDEARALFYEQIKGQNVIELPVHPQHTLDDLIQKNRDARQVQFRALADFLVDSCHILVAIWDDSSPSRAGGTTEVIRKKLGIDRRAQTEMRFRAGSSGLGFTSFGTGCVYHISAHRGDTAAHVPALEGEYLEPRGASRTEFHRIYLLLDEYNFDVHSHPRLAKIADAKARSLTMGSVGLDLTPEMRWCRTVRGWSAALAEHYQARNKRLLTFIFSLIFVMGLTIHLIEPFSKNLGVPFYVDLAVYLASAIGILFVSGMNNGYTTWLSRFITRRFKKIQPPWLPIGGLKLRRKHEDYRALAEALRIQFYWFAAGIKGFACDSYLDKHVGDMIWVRDVTSEALLSSCERAPRPTEGTSFSHSLTRTWLQGQFNYFEKRSKLAERRHRRLNRFAWGMAVPTFLCPMILLSVYHLGPIGLEPNRFTSSLTLCAGLLLLISVILWNFSEVTGYEQEAQQSRQMHRLFEAALLEFDDLIVASNERSPEGASDKDPGIRAETKIKKLLERIGKDALTENGDWLALHRGRDFKLNRTVG